MRILFLSRWFPYPYDNGSKIQIYHLLKGLARNHTVDLISFYEEPITSQSYDALKQLCSEVVTIPYRPFQPGSMKAITGFFTDKPRSVIDTYQEQYFEAVQNAAAKNHYDVLIASEIDMAIYGLPIEVPVKILEELEVTKALRPLQVEARWLRKLRHGMTWWKLSRYLRILLENYDGCTFVSEEERNALYGSVSMRNEPGIVPNGVDISEFQPSLSPKIEADSLIYNGAITYPVNFEAVAYFIREIFPHILAQRQNAHFYVTGKVTPELI
ncbi:hypothetical protein EG832_22235, partial [bacterium]|nr:hypothetical protein [bacterium]